MLNANLWSKSVPQVELDQQAHEARLRVERIEPLFMPRAAVTDSWLRRAFGLFSFALYGEARQGNRTRGPLSNRRPSRMPKIQEDCLEVCGSVCSA